MQMPALYRTTIIAVTFLLIGCDIDSRITKLEKQNQELQAEIKKNQAALDFDTQAKCSRDSKVWFKENFPSDKSTILVTYTDHYNKSLNKCFILGEHHYNSDPNTWTNYMGLWDVYENAKYGEAAFDHTTSFKPDFQVTESTVMCEVYDKKCTTIDEFNNFVRPYMAN